MRITRIATGRPSDGDSGCSTSSPRGWPRRGDEDRLTVVRRNHLEEREMKHQDRLLPPRDVAEELGVTVRTLMRWLRQGRIPHVDLGKVKRIPRSDLDTFLRARRKPGNM